MTTPDPESKPTLDRSTLLPILLGVFSLFGILLVFLLGRVTSGRNNVPAPDTATPFKYQLIGTEPGISTSEPITEEPLFGDETAIPDTSQGPPGLQVTAIQGSSGGSGSSSGSNPTRTRTPSSAILTLAGGSATNPIIILNPGTRSATPNIVIIERSQTPTRTPGPTITVTPSRTRSATLTPGTPATKASSNCPSANMSTPTVYLPLIPGTYDDDYLMLDYGDDWPCQVVAGAYQNTLHVSTTVGSELKFNFTGQQIRLTFQGGGSLGTIRINIGGLNFDLDQSNGTDEWVSALLSNGTYTVTITHASGGSVNIDSIIIPDIPTGTPPTATPSSTSAPGAP